MTNRWPLLRFKVLRSVRVYVINAYLALTNEKTSVMGNELACFSFQGFEESEPAHGRP